MSTIKGQLRPPNGQIAILTSRFNSLVTDGLTQGALETLAQHGVAQSDIDVVSVPGAFELPLTIDRLAASGRYRGIIALGAVIKGQTAHFDFVAGPVANQISQLALTHQLPIIFGVLTTETLEQALDRAGGKAGNKGAESAVALMEMCDLMSQINA